MGVCATLAGKEAVVGRVAAVVAAGLLVGLAAGCGGGGSPEERGAAGQIELLSDLTAETRMAAARELGRLRHRPAVPDLIERLSDVRMDVRTAAAEALGEIGDPRAAPALTEQVGTPNWALRRAIVDALVKIRAPESVSPLGALMDDENTSIAMAAAVGLSQVAPAGVEKVLAAAADASPRVRRCAAYALERVDRQEADRALAGLLGDADRAVRLEALESVAKRGRAEMAGSIVRMIADPEKAVRERATELAGRMGVSVVPALAELAQHADAKVRLSAVGALRRLGVVEVVPALLQAAGDKSADVRNAAGEAVSGLLRDASYRAAAIATARENAAVRLHVLTMLEETGGADVLEVALLSLNDASADARLVSARIVTRSRQPAALERLLPLLDDKALPVRQAAAAGLIEGGNPRAADLLIEGLKRRAADATALGQEELVLTLRMLGAAGDRRAVEFAIGFLDDRNADVSVAAAEALGRIGDRRAVEALRRVLAGADPGRAVAAGHALARLKDSESVPTLMARFDRTFDAVDAFSNGSWRVYGEVTQWLPAISNFCDPRSLESLIPKLRLHGGAFSQNPAIYNLQGSRAGAAVHIAETLAFIGDPRAFDPILDRVRLSQRLDNRSEARVRGCMVSILMKLDRARMGKAIGELIQNEARHREENLLHYCRLAAECGDAAAAPALIGLLGCDAQKVEDLAIQTLIGFGPPAVEEAIRMLESAGAERRSHIAALLARIGQPALEPLMRAAGSDSEKARQGAVWALGQIADPRATEQLLKSLKDSSLRVQAAAAWGLAESRAEAGVEPLVALLNQDSEAVAREAAARALGSLGDRRAVAALTAALGATNAALRGTAVVSLGQIGGDAAADALRDLLKRETNDDVRSAAAGSLRAIEKTKPAKEVRSGNG